MKKISSILLLAAMLGAMISVPSSAAGRYNPILKIGLYYDSAAMAAANLQNVSGYDTGYSVGYWNTSREFVPLYELSENKLTILKDRNMWVTSGNVYYDTLPSSFNYSIGSIHWQVDTLYGSAEEAAEVAASIKALGCVAYLVCVKDGYRVRVGEYLSEELANAAYPELSAKISLPLVLRSASSTGYVVTVTGTDNILCGFDFLGQPLGIRPNSTITWFKQVRYYGGFEYNRISGNNMNVINVIDMNHYIKGVVPYEVNTSWPIEAQKAEALCAKCYAYNNFNKHKSKGFDLCNTDDCQVYGGTERATATSDAAVDALDGIFVTYNGKVCQTYYHSTSGGYTEDAVNIWGTDIPYLKAVEDKYLEVFNPYSYTLTLDQITTILQAKGYTKKKVIDLYVSKVSAVGNALTLTFVEEDGTVRNLTGDLSRTALNYTGFSSPIKIGSHRYTITDNAALYTDGEKMDLGLQSCYAIGADGVLSKITVGASQLQVMTGSGLQKVDAPTESYTISGTGMGHNIGMSQWGSYSMAKLGFTYDQIIKFYFTGVEVGYFEP